MSSILKLQSIHKTFRLKDKPVGALQGVDIDIPEGSITGIIGLSGAGKSTLLRCMNLLERPDKGSIHYKEKDILSMSGSQLREVRKDMGMIFQHFNLLSRRTAFGNVALPLEIRGFARSAVEQKICDCLKQVGLYGKETAYPSELSGGQKQRVAIARALASDAKVLLCDEATSALDPQTTSDILHLLKDLNQRLGLTIILITHEIHVVKTICDYVHVLDKGLVVEQGAVEDIFSNPQHALTKNLTHTVFHPELPEFVQEQLAPKPLGPGSEAVLRLLFSGQRAQQPVVANFIKKSDTNVNIVAGYLDHIGKKMFGSLLVTIQDEGDSLRKAAEYLSEAGVIVEVLGYIPQGGAHA